MNGRNQQANLVGKQTISRIEYLQNIEYEGRQRALLANLRRGVGREPGDIPGLWGMLLDDLPKSLQGPGKDGGPSDAERSIYTALTLFAVHQQGKDLLTEMMHVQGQGLGRAVSCLVETQAAQGGKSDAKTLQQRREDARETVAHRFNRIATAADIRELAQHLRGMVQMLRREDIALDYGQLASDLYQYQDVKLAPSVRLRWGRDFYRTEKENDQTAKESDPHA